MEMFKLLVLSAFQPTTTEIILGALFVLSGLTAIISGIVSVVQKRKR